MGECLALREHLPDIWRKQLGHLPVNSGRTRQYMPRLQEIFAAVQSRNNAARLPDNERTGGQIPDREAGFPEQIKASCGDVTKIESCGATAANAGSFGYRFLKHFHIRRNRQIRIAKRKTGTEQ